MRASRLRVLADPEKRAKAKADVPKFKWFTNGVDNVHVNDGDEPPTGWRRGRTIDAQKLVASRTPGAPRKRRNPVLSDPSTLGLELFDN